MGRCMWVSVCGSVYVGRCMWVGVLGVCSHNLEV